MSDPNSAGGSGPRPEPVADDGFGAETGQILMSASADGIVAIDGDGRIRLCNPAAEELFGRPSGELVGTQLGYPLLAGAATEIELMLPGGDRRVVEMRVTVTTVEGEPLFVASLRDITRRQRVERELKAALERQHAVAAVAAHELRAPLAAISALTHALRSPALTAEQRSELLDRIADRTAGLQALVRKLLIASRIDTGPQRQRMTRVPLLELLLERLADFDERSTGVNVSCAPEVVVFVNRNELSEMLGNYLENAFVHGQPPVEVQVTERAEWVDVRVSDHGPGIPEEFRPHLFERFSRDPATERQTEGSGLGLWIVRSLARANGGEASYEAGDDGGACFSLRLRRPYGI